MIGVEPPTRYILHPMMASRDDGIYDVAYVLQDQFWSVLGMLMFFAQFGNIFGGMDICNISGICL